MLSKELMRFLNAQLHSRLCPVDSESIVSYTKTNIICKLILADLRNAQVTALSMYLPEKTKANTWSEDAYRYSDRFQNVSLLL